MIGSMQQDRSNYVQEETGEEGVLLARYLKEKDT